MITLPKIWNTILVFLGFREEDRPHALNEIEHAANAYEDKHGYNLPYVIANKIANLVVTDSQINVKSESTSARIDFLQMQASKLWTKKKRLVSRVAGYGKILVIPYVSNALYYDIVPQHDVILLSMDGEKPIDVVVLADTQRVNTTLYGKYKRYTLEGTTHTISEFYTNFTTSAILSMPPIGTTWAESEPFIIQNVTQLLFGSFDCPIDPRRPDDFYGAGVGDGMKDLFDEVKEQYEYLAKEYKRKEAFVGMDADLLNLNPESEKYELPESGLFRLLSGNSEAFFQIFDPAIRNDPIFARLKDTLENIENQVGLSRGILTNPESIGTYTNADNIKRSVYDTYALVTEFRDNVVKGMQEYLYACNVLAEHFALTPQGVSFDDVTVGIDWSNALVESTSEEYSQMIEGLNLGIYDKVELRQWQTGENQETATQRIKEIEQGGGS